MTNLSKKKINKDDHGFTKIKGMKKEFSNDDSR